MPETLQTMPPPEKPPVPHEEPPETTPPTPDPKAIDADDAQIEPPKDDAFKKK